MLSATTRSEGTEKVDPDSSQRCMLIGQTVMSTSWNIGNSDQILGKKELP